MGKNKPYTTTDIRFIKQNPHLKVKELAIILNRNHSALAQFLVKQKIKLLELRCPIK